MPDTKQTSLSCAIVGAGIAGLAAAIALRNSKHTVTVFEKSTFKNEIGAAITITPNGNRVLDVWNFDAESAGETAKEQSRFVDPETLAIVDRTDLSGVRDGYGSAFNAFHRVDLHQGLRKLAEGLGANIVLGNEVVGLDCENGELYFESGEVGKWDLIIAADGVKGAFVKPISGSNAPLIKTGKSVFRGLVPMDILLDDHLVRPLFEGEGSGFLSTLSKSGIFIMTYPCRSDKILNIGLFHDTRIGHENDEGWNSPAALEEVLKVMEEGLHQAWRAIVTHARHSMKCFPIMLREPLPRYNNGRAALIGDAAHPMMPTNAQGGCMSLEDAAALETFFPSDFDAKKESVAKRLQLFSDFRIPRDNTTQLYSKLQMPQNVDDKENAIQEHLSNIRKFYNGPLLPVDSSQFAQERQQFFYPYDVFEQASLAMKLKDREAGAMQNGVKHFL